MKELEKYRYDKSVCTAAIGRCGMCYMCIEECPENAIEKRSPVRIDYKRCTRCMRCVAVCPTGVMQIID